MLVPASAGTRRHVRAVRKQYRPFDHIVKLDCDRSEMPTRRDVAPS